MLALKLTSMKTFMNHLLVADTFDNFLLVEAVISTSNTYHIDGHVNKDFFSREELSSEEICPYEFSPWQEFKGLCYHLIKGRRTPLFFKFVLHLKPDAVSRLLAAGDCALPATQIKALVLTIRYDGTQAVLTTGSAFHTFVMSKEPDILWDKALQQFLSRHEIGYETL